MRKHNSFRNLSKRCAKLKMASRAVSFNASFHVDILLWVLNEFVHELVDFRRRKTSIPFL